jgi:hypothetical protein
VQQIAPTRFCFPTNQRSPDRSHIRRHLRFAEGRKHYLSGSVVFGKSPSNNAQYPVRIGGRYYTEIPPAANNDANFFTGQWTVYSGLCNDSEDESSAPGAGRTRRSTSTPPANQSRLPADLYRHDDLARRIGRSPSSERRTTKGASSIPTEAFSDGFLRSASSEPRATEAASSYVSEDFEGGLTLSKRAERSAAEEASPHYSEPVTSGFAPSGVADAEIGISDGVEISSTVVTGGPPTVVEETGVSHQTWRQVEEASPESSEAPMEDTVPVNLGRESWDAGTVSGGTRCRMRASTGRVHTVHCWTGHTRNMLEKLVP